ncbi:MAG: D-alanyl-D-alanine carboxypeptidase [Anaerostipes sp.]|nr:D-alanyl-D-alanine carboxypeptidase [Anaerostipes sp.]
MRKIFIICFSVILCFCQGSIVFAKDEPKLYAKACILMEAESGRVLYEKNSKSQMANASTTKILTCYYVILHSKLNETVKISKNAARQPKVSLGVREGESYQLGDLLYGLMLESYNDCAVALAEHVEGSVPAFEKKINKLAKKMGAKNTHFVTPNGLDKTDAGGSHRTTAYDLALIMKKCLKNKTFLKITRCLSYSFSDRTRKRNFSCQNHNALLRSMEGAISGKTGFTTKAGFCYVGAVKRQQMTLIVVLLGCGWPPHKTYKWTDVNQLVLYGTKHYERKEYEQKGERLKKINVIQGVRDKVYGEIKPLKIHWIQKKSEDFQIKYTYKKQIQAPVKMNTTVGKVTYFSGRNVIGSQNIYASQSIQEKSVWWYLGKIIVCFFKL